MVKTGGETPVHCRADTQNHTAEENWMIRWKLTQTQEELLNFTQKGTSTTLARNQTKNVSLSGTALTIAPQSHTQHSVYTTSSQLNAKPNTLAISLVTAAC